MRRSVAIGRSRALAIALALLLLAVASAQSPASAQERPAVIVGLVLTPDDVGVGDVKVDLFETAESGGRGQFLGTTRTSPSGQFEFEVPGGCYTLTVISPDERRFDGSRWYQPSVCLPAGDRLVGLRARFDDALDASVGGTITDSDGGPAAGVKTDLFRAAPFGGRAAFLGFATTDEQGHYRFAVEAGCYVAVLIAPAGSQFVGGNRFLERTTCVESGQSTLDIDAALIGQETSLLGGRVRSALHEPVEGVKVTLYRSTADGGRGEFLRPEFTNADGRFSAGVGEGCYWLIFVAPDGDGFRGNRYFERTACVEAGRQVLDLDARLDQPRPFALASVQAWGSRPSDEGGAGESFEAFFRVSLVEPAPARVSVDVVTIDGTATAADRDYQPTTSTVVFEVGEQHHDVPVLVFGDDAEELNESFVVGLANPSPGLAIRYGLVGVPLRNDDFSVRHVDVPRNVGLPNTDEQLLPITLSAPAAEPVTVDVATVDFTLRAADGGYQPVAETVTFAPGEQVKHVALRSLVEPTRDGNGHFLVRLSNPSEGLQLGTDTTAVAVINRPIAGSQEQWVGLTGQYWQTPEGGAITPRLYLTRPQPLGITYTLRLQTVGVSATADADYTPLDEIVTLVSGADPVGFTIPIPDDELAEADETVLLVLSEASANLDFPDTVVASRILDDDSGRNPAKLFFGNNFGQESSGRVRLSLRLGSNVHRRPISVDVTTIDGVATVADGDYLPFSGRVTFPVGNDVQHIDIQVLDDDIFEQPEQFAVLLSNPSPGVELQNTVALALINDDD